MKLLFRIDYRTNWGESLYLCGDTALLGNGDTSRALRLEVDGDRLWHAEVELPDSVAAFTYRYIIKNEQGDTRQEWGQGHCFRPAAGVNEYDIYDRWQDQPFDKPFYSAAFTECICRHNSAGTKPLLPASGYVELCVAAPMVAPGCTLAISGEGDALGNWNPDRAIRMNSAEYPIWKAKIPAAGLNAATEYKYLIVDSANGRVVSWEGGNNRSIGVEPRENAATILAGMRFINAQTPWKGAGTAIPVFSLRTESDFGVGDFYDLKEMVDWAAAAGQTFLQILPINDTTMTGTWVDSYPYKANSIYALHPMFLRLEAIGELKDKKRREYYESLRKELNALPEVDYERVNKAKAEYCREIFASDGAKTMASPEYKAFIEKNGHWLLPYAAFCVLRDRFGTPDFNKWGEYAVYSADVQAKVQAEAQTEIDFVCYQQFHLDAQMRHVHEYANSHSIALKGDIPIGISRTSADAWVDPRLFNLDCQAGAPPDDFSVLGQNWGLPTYNWEEMSLDGFAWWKARFAKMAEFFDAYRIDHVLGFFRIWQIPMDAIHGLLGYFNPALPFSESELRNNYDFWIDADLQTTPYIMDYFVEDFFGPYTREALDTYCNSAGYGRYKLKPEFDTQRKVADHFATLPKDEKHTRICDGLLGLIDNVLFIEDPVEKGKYHPRISAQYTYIYRALNDYERWCFNRLYNDFFYHRHNSFWYDKAMWKLPPLIDSTNMLTCAEDLGMIPACVPAVMQQLEILSLEIQRMPKDPGSTFGDTWSYPYYSVCTTSTHDMGGIRQWWEEDRDRSRDFYNNVLHEHGAAPYYAEPWVCDRIVDLHLASPSMLCILPLQDWLSIDANLRRENPNDEIINVPANPQHYWRYRMHLTIAELASHIEFTSYLRDKTAHFGR
ncbi:4-alpha-glucanotransferase [Muribaculaceae bacterium]|jgi:4-alpha-glucanotransferase|nr:4-alpha-glucanotransferase [Muribaculaceae bacterium]